MYDVLVDVILYQEVLSGLVGVYISMGGGGCSLKPRLVCIEQSSYIEATHWTGG